MSQLSIQLNKLTTSQQNKVKKSNVKDVWSYFKRKDYI